MARKEIIVAIELGSSKLTGIAGRKNFDGSINVLAVAKEDSSSFIRRGVVYNIDKTALCISNVVKKLSTQLKAKITQVYVGVGGQSLRSVKNVIVKELAPDTKVTDQLVADLMDTNRSTNYPEKEILDVISQEYKVDNQYLTDPVGIQCSHIEGHFLNILQRASFYRSLRQCFETAGVRIAEMYISPIALAECVLTDPEKRSGCALVDLGAATTTVAVYNKNILRHLAVIPLGGNNITKDIATLQMEESDAEKMKLRHAEAYTEPDTIDDNLTLPIDTERTVESRKFIEIVEGRLEEIIRNVWEQIPVEYTNLFGGIILTGGGSNMKNIVKAFTQHTQVNKIRIAKFVNQNITTHSSDINAKDGTMNTVLALMIKGDDSCVDNETETNQTGTEGTVRTAPNGTKTTETTPGNKKKEDKGEGQKEEEGGKTKGEKEKPKKKGIAKFGQWIKDFTQKITEEDDDE